MSPPDCGAAPVRHAVFPTALGVCGVAWRDGTLVRLQLPEATPEATGARMLRGLSGRGEAAEPEGVAAEAVAGVQALFAGHGPALDHLPLAWDDVAPLTRRVLEACRAIPHGETRTYGDLARALGDVGLSQAVGQALGRNPFAPVVPCHRVLGADGRIGGFSGGDGRRLKLAILNAERASTSAAPGLFEHLPLATCR